MAPEVKALKVLNCEYMFYTMNRKETTTTVLLHSTRLFEGLFQLIWAFSKSSMLHSSLSHYKHALLELVKKELIRNRAVLHTYMTTRFVMVEFPSRDTSFI